MESPPIYGLVYDQRKEFHHVRISASVLIYAKKENAFFISLYINASCVIREDKGRQKFADLGN